MPRPRVRREKRLRGALPRGAGNAIVDAMKRFFLLFPLLISALPLAASAADDAVPAQGALPPPPEAAVVAEEPRNPGETVEMTEKTAETVEIAPETAEIPAENAVPAPETVDSVSETAEIPPESTENAPEMAENAVETVENTPETVENAPETPEVVPETPENGEKEAEKPEKTAAPAADAAASAHKLLQNGSFTGRFGPLAGKTPAAEPAFAPLASRATLEQLLPRDGILLDSYAAVVGKKIITVGDVFAICQPRLQRIAAGAGSRAETVRRAQEVFDEARDSLVADQLILLAFADAGGTLPDRAIEDHISEVLQTRFGGDREQLFSALASARLSMDDWRRKMTDQLAIQVMRQKEISARLLVTPGDVRAAYEADKAQYAHPERVHIRMLSIPRGTTAEEVAASRRLAQRIRERILSGVADFPRAARLLSHATGAGENAGDAGWHDVADLMPGVAEAVEKLSPGGISPVLEVPPFLYLVQLEDRADASVDAFEDVADDIESKLKNTQYDKLEKAWLDTLKGKYFVQTYRHELF